MMSSKDGRSNPKTRNKRGCGFTVAKDVSIENSWAEVSENAIVGAEQKEEIFYKSIRRL